MDDYEELACLACEAELLTEPDEIEELLLTNLGVTMRTFTDIVDALVPHTIPAKLATLDGREVYAQGFVNDGAFIVKNEIRSPR